MDFNVTLSFMGSKIKLRLMVFVKIKLRFMKTAVKRLEELKENHAKNLSSIKI